MLSCVNQIQTPQLAKQLAVKRHLFLEPVALPILVAGGVLLSTGQQLHWLNHISVSEFPSLLRDGFQLFPLCSRSLEERLLIEEGQIS